MSTIPTYDFRNIGRKENLADIFIWAGTGPYEVDQPHCHAYHEIMVFVKGGGTHEIDFKTFEVRDHSFHIIPGNFVHRLARGPRSSGFTIAVSRMFVELASQFDPTIDYNSFFEHEQVINLTEKEFSEFSFYLDRLRKPGLSAANLQHLCLGIIINLFPFFSVRKTNYSGFIADVRKMLEKHYMQRLSALQYAEMFNLTAANLNLRLKKATGKTIMQLQDDMFLSEVKKQLYSSESSLKEIALDFGFKDYAHFSKFFKQHTDYSPSEYRAQLKKIQENRQM